MHFIFAVCVPLAVRDYVMVIYHVRCVCSAMALKAILQLKGDAVKLVHFVVTPAKYRAASDDNVYGITLRVITRQTRSMEKKRSA